MIRKLWGKRSRDNEAISHPLVFHLIDVAAVAGRLWGEVLERSARAAISRALGLAEEAAGGWVAIWAGLHDLGKASPVFQGKWAPARKWLADAGLTCPPPSPIPHGFLTTIFVRELFQEFLPDNCWTERLGKALGGHHGVFPRSGDLEQVSREAAGGKKWHRLRLNLLQEFGRLWGMPELPPPRATDPGHAFFLLLAGLVCVADWVGSNEEFFPFTPPDVSLEEYHRRALQQAQAALQDLAFTGWRAPFDYRDVAELFPMVRTYGLRPLQQAVKSWSQNRAEPGLVILEAPMGEGKTEAAMYLADQWAVALGQRGCYFALPTMATSNQMFQRVKEFLGWRYPENLVNLQLLHGHASLTAEFQALRQRADQLFCPADIETEGEITGRPPAEVVAAEWFTHRKRGLLAPFGVGTVDQILLAVLPTRHYFVRLFGLAHKTVIVDEVHAYDAYMCTLLERLLQWLAALGCSVVLLSATLPRARREALVAAYQRGLEKIPPAVEIPWSPYPRLTWITPSDAGTQHFKASPRFHRTLKVKWLDGRLPSAPSSPFSLGEKLQQVLAQGGCAAIICNTVSRAQEVFAALEPYFPHRDAGDGFPELDLFHARCLFQDRQERERRCLIRFGRPEGLVDTDDSPPVKVRRPRRAVLVATQVIEQSLDLDFDLLVTEMAPVDLILQRAGRLHRHDRPRPDNLQEPTLWILEPEMPGPVPVFGEGTEAVYDFHLLLRSWLALRERATLTIPQEVEELIEAVYGEGPPPEGLTPEILGKWEDSRHKLLKQKKEEEMQARYRYILPPDYRDDLLEDPNPQLEEDDPGIHHSLQAATRLGDPTVPVICLYEKDGQAYLDREGQHPVNLEEKPDGPTTRALLARSVSLSHRGLTFWLLGHGHIPPGWLRHPLLCRYCLILLDDQHRWQGGNHELHLDPELGVVIRRVGKEILCSPDSTS
ncbi:MAG: CRISPR-associated helicase Cas3' [Syntrophobacterales bacterium]|nr:CRISPR-associated helicase Cas3' [Syntrophobacterales bacterium]